LDGLRKGEVLAIAWSELQAYFFSDKQQKSHLLETFFGELLFFSDVLLLFAWQKKKRATLLTDKQIVPKDVCIYKCKQVRN